MTERERVWLYDYPTAHDGYAGLSRVSRDQLAYLIRCMPETGRLLEIGTASGVTAALIADARPNLWIVCVDTFGGSTCPEILREEGDRLSNWRANQRPNMHLWFGATWDFIPIVQPEARFDVVFVDADHGYECTLLCLRDAANLVRHDGVILAHDWGDPHWPKVEKAGEAFCEESGFRIVDSFSSIRMLRSP